MSISFQTNVTSLIAQNNLRINTNFQNQTIQQLTSGYRINSSGDDAAGLAIANKYRSDTAELTQGVRNANDGVSTLQTVDGGLNNISQILDRLKTLATQSASATFTGDRGTLNSEYQTLLGEVTRQSSDISLNSGGALNSKLTVYIGGGTTQANAQVSVDLSGSNNAVDSTSLGIGTSSVAGGGASLTGNTVRLDDTAVSFLAGSNSQVYTFHLTGSTGNNQDVAVSVLGGASGLSGTQVISSLNTSLQAYGISASIGSAGTVQFGGSEAFSVSVAAASGGNTTATTASSTVNTGNNTLNSTYAAVTVGSEKFTVQNSGGSYNLTLDTTTGATQASALAYLNTQLSGSGISAVKGANGTDISFQSTSTFSLNETQLGTGGAFTVLGAQAVTAPSASSTSTGNSLSALTALETAVTNLGKIQGHVGAGENLLNYSVSWLNRKSAASPRRSRRFAIRMSRRRPPT